MPTTISHVPIHDMSWMKHMFSGRIRERFHFFDYRVVAIELNPSTRSSYHYRLLFFHDPEQKPLLSLNLETSILGSSCITEQMANKHINLGPGEPDMDYESFKTAALVHAEQLLGDAALH